MKFIVSANTDIGAKSINQDCLSVLSLNTCQGPMAFAVLCDGMGGLQMGEVASASVVSAFRTWAMEELPALCSKPLTEYEIAQQWSRIVTDMNVKIMDYSREHGVHSGIGTTVVALLLTQTHYFVLNVGDSRAYELCGGICQLTTDHSLVAREVALGHITEEQAKYHPQRNALLQCIGAMDAVYPDITSGPVSQDSVYLLCSDGFRHEVAAWEIYENLHPALMTDIDAMNNRSLEMVELNKQRGETDNISLVLIKTV